MRASFYPHTLTIRLKCPVYQGFKGVRVKIRVGEGKGANRAMDIVETVRYIMRLAKGKVFAEWKQSDTARLFEDHGYKNKRIKLR